ncbi:hypothetical protein GCM10027052_27560 [Parafrigoribacterium mesophilum]
MSGRHADRSWIIGQMTQADGAPIVRERADETLPARQMADGGNFRRCHPHLEKLLKAAVGRKHTEGAVLGADEFYRRFNDAPEHDRKVEMLDHRLVGSKKRVQAALRNRDALCECQIV